MINYDLTRIRAIIFDVDGVLSSNTIPTSAEGELLRTTNVKDGYAIHLAIRMGIRVAIMTGGITEAIVKRFKNLGLEDIYIACNFKIDDYHDFMSKYALLPEEVIYVGDDIPDYEVMKEVPCSCCPKDAAPEIQEVSHYISHCNGGEGVGRDIVEQVLRAQGKWMTSSEAFGW